MYLEYENDYDSLQVSCDRSSEMMIGYESAFLENLLIAKEIYSHIQDVCSTTHSRLCERALTTSIWVSAFWKSESTIYLDFFKSSEASCSLYPAFLPQKWVSPIVQKDRPDLDLALSENVWLWKMSFRCIRNISVSFFHSGSTWKKEKILRKIQ